MPNDLPVTRNRWDKPCWHVYGIGFAAISAMNHPQLSRMHFDDGQVNSQFLMVKADCLLVPLLVIKSTILIVRKTTMCDRHHAFLTVEAASLIV